MKARITTHTHTQTHTHASSDADEGEEEELEIGTNAEKWTRKENTLNTIRM